MSGFLTSSSLIDTVKREAMLPSSASTFSDADFLAIANQEMRISVVPQIIQMHEEYFVKDSDPITIVANQSNYPIPYRAVGSKFRDVFYKDTNGNLRSMSRISPDDRPYYQQASFQNSFVFFYLRGNDVVLVPDVGSNPVGSLVFSFYMRPNELVDESRVATIQSISVGATTTSYTVDQIPLNVSAFIQNGQAVTGFTPTTILDILQTKPGHKIINFDKVPTAVDTTNKIITFNNTDLGSSIVAGDYIAFAGECIIPNIPADLHDVLAQRVVTRCLLALGDQAGYQMASQKLMDMNQNTQTLIDNRSEGEPQKINNRNSLLNSSKIRRRGWGAY